MIYLHSYVQQMQRKCVSKIQTLITEGIFNLNELDSVSLFLRRKKERVQ